MLIQSRKYLSSTCSALCAALLFVTAQAHAWQTSWRSCAYTGHGQLGAPVNDPPPPHCCSGPPGVDGDIDGDPGWTGAWRYVFNNGTPAHDVAIQAVANTASLWLSFEVNNDQALNSTDEIVIGIDPGGSGQRRLLTIKPLINGGVASPLNVKYWPSFPYSGGGVVPPFVYEAAASQSGPDLNKRWVVELRLPLADLGISSSADFGLYMNVLVNQGTGGGPTDLVNEYAWPVPASDTEWLLGDDTALPDPSKWGMATVSGTACNGVSVAWGDIGTLNTPKTKILLGQQNTFRAVVKNNSLDAAGQPTVVAKKITAKFSYATFGMSTVWTPVPTDPGTTNPVGPTDIPANGQQNFDTKWTVPANDPNFPDGGKTCVRVDLDTLAGGGVPDWTTVFANRSSWNNFHYSTASKVKATPVIDTRKWLPPPSGGNQQVELFFNSQVDIIDRNLARSSTKGEVSHVILKRDKAPSGNPWRAIAQLREFPVERNESFNAYLKELLADNVQVSQLVQLVHGCRRSGKFIKIDTDTLEICERIGSFGSGLRHAGIGKTVWSTSVEGKKEPTHLSLSIPAGRRQPLSVEFTGETQCKCACGDAECRLKCNQLAANDRGAVSGSLALVGALGVGGFAFLRRRRNRKSNGLNEHNENQMP